MTFFKRFVRLIPFITHEMFYDTLSNELKPESVDLEAKKTWRVYRFTLKNRCIIIS